MQVVIIINRVDVYETRSRLRPISINIHQGEVLPNLVLLLPKSTQTLAIKSSHRFLLQDTVWNGHSVF